LHAWNGALSQGEGNYGVKGNQGMRDQKAAMEWVRSFQAAPSPMTTTRRHERQRISRTRPPLAFF